MSLAAFEFTDRCRPVVEMGIGDVRNVTAGAWDTSRWDTPPAFWGGSEPTWVDISCDVRTSHLAYGRVAVTDRFAPGLAQIVVDNASGWADPNVAIIPGELTVRPGRSIRVSIDHDLFGRVVLFRGFVDELLPTYAPFDTDTVILNCNDALAEVNRTKMVPLAVPVGAGEDAAARVHRVLNAAGWKPRDVWPSSETLLATDLGGQVADLLGVTADSAGGAVFGDMEGRVAFRPRDWQSFMPGTPVDGTIGNVAPTDVCPVEWVRPFSRADIATRAIIGRDVETAVVVDDVAAINLYGIEPFERTDLLTMRDSSLVTLANRAIRTRGAATAPRVRSVRLDADTSDAAMDLMTTVDVYRPSRYRCRLQYPAPRGTVFDAQYFATGVEHDISSTAWSLALNLDVAAPFQIAGGKWDSAGWDLTTWADAVVLLTEAQEVLQRIEADA